MSVVAAPSSLPHFLPSLPPSLPPYPPLLPPTSLYPLDSLTPPSPLTPYSLPPREVVGHHQSKSISIQAMCLVGDIGCKSPWETCLVCGRICVLKARTCFACCFRYFEVFFGYNADVSSWRCGGGFVRVLKLSRVVCFKGV